jgi:hypothetical protein
MVRGWWHECLHILAESRRHGTEHGPPSGPMTIDPDKPAFLAIMARLAAAFRTELSEETRAVYFDALRDKTIEQVARAARRCEHECDFFPSIKALRDRCAGGRPEMRDFTGIAERERRAAIAAPVQIGEALEHYKNLIRAKPEGSA